MLEFLAYTFPTLWFAWALLVWLSPCVFLRGARKVTGDSLLLPAWFIHRCRGDGIDVYVADELPVGDQQGYAFSGYIGIQPVIFVNETFLRFAVQAARDFVLAHELGHLYAGHPVMKVICRMTLIDLIPSVRRILQLQEHEADVFAENFTGHKPSAVWGPTVVTAADRQRGIPTEESES